MIISLGMCKSTFDYLTRVTILAYIKLSTITEIQSFDCVFNTRNLFETASE